MQIALSAAFNRANGSVFVNFNIENICTGLLINILTLSIIKKSCSFIDMDLEGT